MTKLDTTDAERNERGAVKRLRVPIFTVIALAIFAFFAGGFGGSF